MLARNVTYGQLADAAARTGVALYEARPANARESAWRFRIVPLPERDEDGWKLYQRRSTSSFSTERKVHAVCWHGHRQFFGELFKLAPDAVVRTAMAVWTLKTFTVDNLWETYRKNIGAPVFPVCAGEACNCNAGVSNGVWWRDRMHYSVIDAPYERNPYDADYSFHHVS